MKMRDASQNRQAGDAMSVKQISVSAYEMKPERKRNSAIAIAGLLFIAASSQSPAAGTNVFQGIKSTIPNYTNSNVSDFSEASIYKQYVQLDKDKQDGAAKRLSALPKHAINDKCLKLDKDGNLYFACYHAETLGVAPIQEQVDKSAGQFSASASIPTSPFPDALKLNSKVGSSNTIFLDFDGEVIQGTLWNSNPIYGRQQFVATTFTLDSSSSTFSNSEQDAIKRIWARVAEDFSPFDVNVTTVRPAIMSSKVCHVVITESTDAAGNRNPYNTSYPEAEVGGIAYLSGFGEANYSSFRPAWVYTNNRDKREDSIAEAVSHEAGHNFGLTHDGRIVMGTTDEYYSGHGSGEISWCPIMGSGNNYGNVSQWSKGDYSNSTNNQDDLAILVSKLAQRADDVGNTTSTAKTLEITGGVIISSSNLLDDPGNSLPANKGIIEQALDVDVWKLVVNAGEINIRIDPMHLNTPTEYHGGNLDVIAELRDASGTLIQSYGGSQNTYALVSRVVPTGVYYLYIKSESAGNPYGATPSGYTSYGSIGLYRISGTIPQTSVGVQSFELVRNGDFTLGTNYWETAGNFYADNRFTGHNSPGGYAYLSNLNGSSGAGLYGEIVQYISVPANAASTRLSYWYRISTSDSSSTTNDVMTLQILDQAGTFTTLDTLSNVDAFGSYRERSHSLSQFAGQTILVAFAASTLGNTLPTTFRLDDVSVISEVQSPQQAVVYSTSEIHDGSGGGAGNSDGKINAGEEIDLDVAIKNVSSVILTDVSGILTTSSDYIDITDDDELFSDISPGSTRFTSGDFDFDVDPSTPAGTSLLFTLTITSDQGSWSFDFSINTKSLLSKPSPVSVSQITSTSFVAAWDSVPQSSGYFVDISRDNFFSQLLSGYNGLDVVGATSISVTNLLQETFYYCRVRAYSDTETTLSSDTLSIKTMSAYSEWAATFFPNLNDANAAPSYDADSDGMSNDNERISRTNPVDNQSFLWLGYSPAVTPNFVALHWPSVSGVTYQILASSSVHGPFTPLTPEYQGVPPRNQTEIYLGPTTSNIYMKVFIVR